MGCNPSCHLVRERERAFSTALEQSHRPTTSKSGLPNPARSHPRRLVRCASHLPTHPPQGTAHCARVESGSAKPSVTRHSESKSCANASSCPSIAQCATTHVVELLDCRRFRRVSPVRSRGCSSSTSAEYTGKCSTLNARVQVVRLAYWCSINARVRGPPSSAEGQACAQDVGLKVGRLGSAPENQQSEVGGSSPLQAKGGTPRAEHPLAPPRGAGHSLSPVWHGCLRRAQHGGPS